MKRVRGFSMVELMIAVMLAMLVTGAVISVFVGSRQAFQSTSGSAALSDGGRFAINFLEQSVRNAGFMACNTTQRQASILNVVLPSLAYDFTEPLAGYEANNTGVAGAYTVVAPAVSTAAVSADPSTGDWVNGLDPALAGMVVENNDVLVVRSTLPGSQTAYVTAPVPNGTASISVNSAAGFTGGGLAVISDCAKSAAFQVGGVSGTTINFTTGGTPGNSATALGMDFDLGAQLTPVTAIVWFIGPGADGDSALFSYSLNAAGVFPNSGPNNGATEMVPDIEAMQILYGIDTTGTQTVSQYVTADQVPDFNSVMSIKIAVLAASALGSASIPPAAQVFNLLGTSVTAPQDTRARQVFEVTIGVRNSLS
jgi:type IV pilus assembly protein PilW